MAGCFGLAEDHHDHRTPLNQLVEAHPVVDCFQLYRLGLLAPGSSATIETGTGPCRLETDAAGNLTLDGQPIRIVPHSALPLRAFECPRCLALKYRLHRVGQAPAAEAAPVERWLCRICSQLHYNSRHCHRSVPGLHRARWLRRRIGVDPRLFTPIAPKPLNARRYWRLAHEIREIEERLVEHLRVGVADVLQRRLDADRRRGR
jgi:hypothetical protein